MHILLTDKLSCPRCGPEFGLILLADRIEERRVLEGRLGCSNCRETYRITGGAVDLRAGAAPAELESQSTVPPSSPADETEAAVRIAALLGLADASGTVLVAGPGAELAPAIAALVPGLEVAALADDLPAAPAEAPGVSRVAAGARLPFRDRALRGAALTAGADEGLLLEGLRVLVPGARLVVEPAGPETAERLRAAGAQVLLEQEGVVVARAPGVPVQLGMGAGR